MKGLKMELSLRCIHGAKPLLPFLQDPFQDFSQDANLPTPLMKAEDVPARVETLLEELRMARNEISAICAKAAVHRASIIANNVLLVGNSKNIRVLVECMDDTDADSLKSAADYLVYWIH